MARGFESKDVEFQQDEAQRTKAQRHRRTADERNTVNDRLSIELMLARTEADLTAARSPAHRQMLEHAIADLRARLDRQ